MKKIYAGFSIVLGVLLSVSMAVAASSNASLETLTVRATGGATLVPAFSPDRTQYEVSLPSDIRTIHVRGSAWVGSSKLRINDQPVASLIWQRIELKPGVNRVVFNVMAPDGTTQRNYHIAVAREDIKPVADAFLKFVYHDAATGVSMPYRLFVPAGYDAAKKYPLVMFLHGGGENGTDNEKQLAGSEGATVWAKPEEQAKRPAFVLAPQGHPYVNPDSSAPLGGFGITRDREGNRYMTEVLKPSADVKTVLSVLEKVMRDYSVDAKRVYVTGLSQGGFGTWNIGLLRPDLFAALVPIAGGGDTELVSRLAGMPIWAFHSEDDQVVPVTYSRTTIAALRRAGGQPFYTELASGTFFDPNEHWSWVYAYRSEAMREWLFKQAKR
jgi:predicted peptidase